MSLLVLSGCGKEVDTTETVVGTYEYVNPYNSSSYYSATVTVSVKDGLITEISVGEGDETHTNVTASWVDKSIWLDGESAFLQSFVGMSVEAVEAIEVTVAENSTPNAVSGVDYVTGATQSSGRVILALQNALSKLS